MRVYYIPNHVAFVRRKVHTHTAHMNLNPKTLLLCGHINVHTVRTSRRTPADISATRRKRAAVDSGSCTRLEQQQETTSVRQRVCAHSTAMHFQQSENYMRSCVDCNWKAPNGKYIKAFELRKIFAKPLPPLGVCVCVCDFRKTESRAPYGGSPNAHRLGGRERTGRTHVLCKQYTFTCNLIVFH